MVSFGEQCRLNRLATDVYVYIRVRVDARNLEVFATSNKATRFADPLFALMLRPRAFRHVHENQG